MEWVWMAKVFITAALKLGPMKKGRKKWSMAEGLFFDSEIQMTNTPILKGIIQGWQKMVSSIKFKFGEGTISTGATIEQILMLYKDNHNIEEEKIRDLHTFLVNKRLKSVSDLIGNNGDWIKPGNLATQICSTR